MCVTFPDPAAVTSVGPEVTCTKLIRIQLIEVQFAKMTTRIKQALINGSVDVVLLIERLCAISAVKDKNVPLFDDDVFDKIKSIDEFWRKLRMFWNIFDYELLQYIVDISDCMKAQEIFKEFTSSIPSAIKDKDLVLRCTQEHPERSLKPGLRIKVNTINCTLSIKKRAEEIVSKAYNLHKYTLRFLAINEGCIELFYYISKPLKLYLLQFNMSKEILENFLVNKIVSLHIDEFKLKIPSRIIAIAVSSQQ